MPIHRIESRNLGVVYLIIKSHTFACFWLNESKTIDDMPGDHTKISGRRNSKDGVIPMLKRTCWLVAALCGLTISSAWPQRLDAELVGYWNFDGSVEDLSGASNHGQRIGAQYSDIVSSVIGSGQSLDFSADTDHVFIEANESLNSPTFTLAMFTYDRGGGIASPRMASRENDSFEAATNRVPFFAGKGQYAYKPGPGSRANSGGWTWDATIPNLEEWQHVAYVATEADKMQIYVNGELTLEESWDGNPTGFMHIGNRYTGRSEGFDGLIDNVALWNEALDAESIQGLAAGGSVLGDRELPPASPVGPRGAIGSNLLSPVRANQVFSDATEAKLPGLGQTWYAVPSEDRKDAVDLVFRDNEPVVPYFQAQSGITWWSGSERISGIPEYPAEVDGLITPDNYSVKLEGEIFIEKSGFVTFADGVNDFIYLAIDLDRSGTAGDSEEDVLINDGLFLNWINPAVGGEFVPANFENIADGGEWLAIEVNIAEHARNAAGAVQFEMEPVDNGMLYWDALDVLGFPLDHADVVLNEDAANLMIPNTHLRSPVRSGELVIGDAVGTIPARQVGWEIDVNPADGTADTFAVENPNEDIFSTVVDLDGILFKVNPLGEVTEGSSFRIVDADSFVGTPIIATEGWTFDSGSLVFREMSAGIAGDIDGDGMVDFSDFLILSNSFGQTVDPGSLGDIDGDGSVAFSDFLVLSDNFGKTAAAAVPEPSSVSLFGIAVLLVGLLRCRR